jgi:acyl carrier protein
MNIDDPLRTRIEEQLSLYWRELLGVEVVKREDHFLALGGNSLMATILANRIEDEFGVRPSMEVLFDTLDRLAIACHEMLREP